MKISAAVVLCSVVVAAFIGRVVASDVEQLVEDSSANPRAPVGNRLATDGYLPFSGQFPYYAYLEVSIVNFSPIVCSGGLITPNYILAVANGCLKVSDSQIIRYGTATLAYRNYPWEQRINFSASAIRLHPTENIALTRLDYPVTLNKYVQPIRLPRLSDSRSYVNMEGTTVGSYRYLRNRVMSNAQCTEEQPNFNATDVHICTDRYIGGAFCGAGLGSPLTIEDGNGVIMVGLASRIYYCEYNYPTGYARISSFRDWIQSNSNYYFDY